MDSSQAGREPRAATRFLAACMLLVALGLAQAISAQTVTRGPYLQLGTPSSVILRWRTDVATNSRVRFGVNAASLTGTTDNAAVTTEHEVKLTGLNAATQYYYSVGSSTTILVSGLEYRFTTSPTLGTVQPTRIWVLGDSGTADSVAAAVRNGYSSFANGHSTDVWLMLGDNAYNAGTDTEYQSAVFNMYPTFLRQVVLWSTIGNHDTNQSTNPSLSIPYFQIFNLPTDGSAGGVASGTEKYYSFDYGSIHFICLDSMTSSRAPGSPMLTWLETDLANTTQQWIIAFWHHPPYTKGSHDSDTETELIEMRSNVLPILEAGGVDLVLAGHSHSYERSFFINGHYGLSTSFTNAMKVDGGSGRIDGSGAYKKQTGLPANQGAVYAVAGNGGHVTNWTGGSTAEYNPTPHPAMFYSALHVGSMVLDVNGNQLDVKMIRDSGAVDDYFTLVKNDPITPPPAPTALVATAGNAQVGLTWNASVGAASYSIKRASLGGGPYATLATTLATNYTDASAINGNTYYYVVSGSNSAGEGANSSEASATPLAASPTVAITSDSPDPSVVGVAYTVAASVSGGSAPAGSITVSDGSKTCIVVLPAASCALTSTTAGTKTLVATYSGDSHNNAAVSAGVAHTVNKATTVVNITSDSPDPSAVNQPYTVVANVTGAYGTATGKLTVSDGADGCSITLPATSCVMASTTYGTGSKTLTVSYGGDANNKTATKTTSHTVTTTCSFPNPVLITKQMKFTLPAGFTGTGGYTFVDQASTAGIQVDVLVFQGTCDDANGIDFRTKNVSPVGSVSIGHTTPANDGTVTGSLKIGTRLYALGKAGGAQAMWRVPFDNAPDEILVRSDALLAAGNCGLVDMPAGFSIAGSTFNDQGGKAGTQVSVTLAGNYGGIPDRITFNTTDVTPASSVSIARSTATSSDGSITADGRCFNMGGQVVAFGLNAGTKRISWTPRFNTGTTKYVDFTNGVVGFDP